MLCCLCALVIRLKTDKMNTDEDRRLEGATLLYVSSHASVVIILIFLLAGRFPAGTGRQLFTDLQADRIVLAYVILLLPTVVVRAIDHSAVSSNRAPVVPHGWTIFAQCIFTLSGAINVMLWLSFGRQFRLMPDPALSHPATFTSKSRLQPTLTEVTGMTIDTSQRMHAFPSQGPHLDADAYNSAEWDPYSVRTRIGTMSI